MKVNIISEDLGRIFCKCLTETNVLLKADMSGLITDNSKGTRLWDILNNQMSNLLNDSCYETKCSSWKLMVIHDKTTGMIYTAMRESRFENIRKEYLKNANYRNYAVCLARSYNSSLKKTEFINGNLFDNLEKNDPICDDKTQNTINQVLRPLIDKNNKINKYALILFSERHGIITSVRAVLPSPEFEIIEQCNLNKYINLKESIVVDKVLNISDEDNYVPEKNLQLSEKALAKKAKNTSNINLKTDKLVKES